MKQNGNLKGVRCLTNGKYYHGLKYAAMEAGVAPSSMSYAIKHKTPCKGKHYSWESATESNMMAMASQLSEMEMLRIKANAYDMLMLEQKAKEEAEAKRLEDERKAKERHDAEVAKAEVKVERLWQKYFHRQRLFDAVQAELSKAQQELEYLKEKGNEV